MGQELQSSLLDYVDQQMRTDVFGGTAEMVEVAMVRWTMLRREADALEREGDAEAEGCWPPLPNAGHAADLPAADADGEGQRVSPAMRSVAYLTTLRSCASLL